MGSTRQPTLAESWKAKGVSSRPAFPTPTGILHNGSSSAATTSWRRGIGQTSRGRGQQQGRGRGGRGRGRGRGSAIKFNNQTNSSFVEDDDDICCLAVGQFELETSDVCKAFENANAAANLPGFDETAGQIWIYPTNRPVRDYQFQIVQTALFNNTLVSLPTGLGKTFIAAVVMYNFHRWYPQDLIIFMAPTRPLVAQQLEACHNIVGIHPSKTVELTGHISPKKREELWRTKSVFFLTPQVMTSDLSRGVCPAEKVRCVVVDEAHKALGQHAYAQVIAMLTQKNALFRVLALSATPGSDVAAVQQVFKNLLISRVELRSESSSDILPYIHTKQVDKIVVTLDDYLKSVHERVLEVYQHYTGKLMKQNVIHGRDGSSMTGYQLLKARQTFREQMAEKFPNYLKGYIEVDFATCISLAHAIDLLLYHGLRSFYIFLQGIFNKEKGNPAVTAELKKNSGLQEILTELQEKLNISPNTSLNLSTSSLFTTFSKGPNNSSFNLDESNSTDYMISHPKMKALKETIIQHFKSFETKNETTRVMIFSQYRDSVQEIGTMLSTLGRLVKPMVFIGQANSGGGGKGLKQKDQVQVVQRFRDGGFNVLVATCVGEEGLDIGEVDLIICFDASKSPTRLVQRMGRTGRQRQGRIIFLLTKGKEERSYGASLSLQNSINRNITDPNKFHPYLYKFSPRMVPVGIQPECFKMSIVLTSEQDNGNRNDDVVVIEDDNSKDGFSKPAKPPVVRQKKVPSKSKKAGTLPATAAGSSTNSRTIAQCFDVLLLKEKETKSASSKLLSPNKDVQIIEDIDDRGMLEENCLMNHVAEEHSDSELLCEIFDVVDASTVLSKPCFNIPTPPKPIQWLPEFNNVDKDTILLNNYDLHCLKEKLESYKLVMAFKEKCSCGNVMTSQPDSSPEDLVLERGFMANNENINGSIWRAPRTHSSEDSSFKYPLTVAKKTTDHNTSNGNSMEFRMDEGFVMDDNDPFFDDDWAGEVEHIENIEVVSPKVNKEEKTPQEDYFENASPISIFENSFVDTPEVEGNKNNPPEDLDSSTTSNDDFGSPVLRYQPISNIYLPQHTSPIIKKLSDVPSTKGGFANKSIPYLDDSSTTSNDEDFQSQVWKKNVSKQVDSEYKQQSQVKSQVNRDLFKDDMLLFEDDEDFEEDFQLQSPYFQLEQTPNKNLDIVIDNKARRLQNTSPLPTFSDVKMANETSPKSSQKSDISDLSPDLSQFRVENRIKRIKLDKVGEDELSASYSRMQDPNNKSAELLNKFVAEQKQKNYEEEMKRKVVEDTKKDTIIRSSTVVKVPPGTPHTSIQQRTERDDFKLESNVPKEPVKKKFIFKKKSPSRVSTEGNLELNTSASLWDTTPSVSKSSKTSLNTQERPPEIEILDQSVNTFYTKDERTNSKENVFPTDCYLSNTTHNSNNYSSVKKSSTSNLPVLDDDWIDMRNEHSRSKKIFGSKPSKGIKRSHNEKMVSNNPTSCFSSTNLSRNKNDRKNPVKTRNSFEFTKPSLLPKVNSFNSTSKNKSPCFKMPPPRQLPIVLSDDDDFVPPRVITPKKISLGEVRQPTTPGDSPSSYTGNSRAASLFSSSPIETSKSRESGEKRRRKRRKLKGNPFLDLEADVSDDGSSSCDEEDEFEGLDDFDSSFVVHEASDSISDSQQIRYIRSVRDLEPIPVGRIESPLPLISESNTDEGDYESDSFCVANDDVEFADIGVFTQAMNVAREEILKENPASAKRRKTRRHLRAKLAKEQEAISAVGTNSNNSTTKRRRRIIFQDSSEED